MSAPTRPADHTRAQSWLDAGQNRESGRRGLRARLGLRGGSETTPYAPREHDDETTSSGTNR